MKLELESEVVPIWSAIFRVVGKNDSDLLPVSVGPESYFESQTSVTSQLFAFRSHDSFRCKKTKRISSSCGLMIEPCQP